MTFKKIHRRADLPQFQGLQARAASSEAVTTAGGTTYRGPSVIEPTGPPIVNNASSSSTPAAAGATTTTSAGAATGTSTTSATSAVTSATAAPTTAVPTTPPAGNTVQSAHVSNTPAVVATTRTTRVVTASSSAASATTTSTDSGMGLGSIAGIAVAAIIAIGVASAFIIWLIKRRNKNRDIDEEPFNRNSFLRNSTAIPDDDAPLPSRVRPSPGPAMSERTPTPLYGQQQQFGADPGFNYATQPSYGAVPGQPFSPNPFGPGGAPATPLPHSPGFGTAYDQQGYNHGGYQELTRGGPGGMHEYPPSPASRGFSPALENPHSPGYTGHESFPMPPATVAGGAQFDEHGHEIQHRSMTPAQHGQVVSVRNSLHNGRETPVQLGFAPAPHAGAPGAHAPAHGRAPGQRPETVYDDDDAYGGI